MNPFSLIISILILVLILRGLIRGSKEPLHDSGRRILIPVLYISTSLFELFDPELVLTSGRIVSSIGIGAVLSIPLILLTQFERKSDGRMYYKRNVSLYVLIIVIFSIRFFDFLFISGIDAKTLGFLNNVVTLTYIAIWRIVSFFKFRNAKSRFS
ncbi:CcdC protein domain-containing protein [Cohnella abietis]|uniref:Cobalamin biosynthesis protein CbiX n=1 Tax=Cohnella abietis TaxID=2507935 RepID=A0A3T1DBY5_9BACL|nr:CcdC protein domain-containing protein [Cohnella abietis]BBI35607.1 cobalamin biosynthesis protein CbiX [Cohnella abietis]